MGRWRRETVAPIVERITGGSVRLHILSNYADLSIARAIEMRARSPGIRTMPRAKAGLNPD